MADKLTPGEALEAWAAACSAHPRGDPLTVAVEEALGMVLAGPVRALRPSPAFPAAAMDGIAVCADDVDGAPVRLGSQDFDVVDTGDPVPGGRDTVIMHERIELSEAFASVARAPARGDNVRAVGEDVAEGELLFAPGHRLEPVDVALAAAAGHAELEVLSAPLVAILPTGDEMRPAGEVLAPGELADTNSIMLEAQARAEGCHTKRWPILPDDPARLEAAVRRAVAECDLVLVIAGTSAGRHDYAPEVLATCGRIVANGVAMRPGHPVVLAVVGDTPVMGCPGYPVSAAVAFDELAQPLLRRLGGAPPEKRARITARLATSVRSRAGARERLRVAVALVEGELVAVPLRRGASVLSALSRADGLITAPAGQDSLEAGAEVVVEGLGRAEPTRSDLLVAGPLEAAIERLVLAGAARGLRVTHCEMPDDEALALVAARGCHAACVADGEPAAAQDARVRAVRQGPTRLVAPGLESDLLASLEEEAAATA